MQWLFGLVPLVQFIDKVHVLFVVLHFGQRRLDWRNHCGIHIQMFVEGLRLYSGCIQIGQRQRGSLQHDQAENGYDSTRLIFWGKE